MNRLLQKARRSANHDNIVSSQAVRATPIKILTNWRASMKQWQDLHKRAGQHYSSAHRCISLPHDIVHAFTTALSTVTVYDASTDTRSKAQLQIMIVVTVLLFVLNIVQVFLFRLMSALNYTSLYNQHMDRAADFARVSNKCQHEILKLELIKSTTNVIVTLKEVINMKAELNEKRGALQFPKELQHEEQAIKSSETYAPIYNDEGMGPPDTLGTGIQTTIHAPVMVPSSTGIIVENMDTEDKVVFDTQVAAKEVMEHEVDKGIEMMHIPRQRADVGDRSVFLSVMQRTTRALQSMMQKVRNNINDMEASQRRMFIVRIILSGLRIATTSIFGMNVTVGNPNETTTTSRVSGILLGVFTMLLYTTDGISKITDVDKKVLSEYADLNQLQMFLLRVNRATVETAHDAVARRKAFLTLLMYKAELGSSLHFDDVVLDVFNVSAFNEDSRSENSRHPFIMTPHVSLPCADTSPPTVVIEPPSPALCEDEVIS